eukprot:7044812-Alexandrium_andersonii.AAC.1
MGLSTPRGAPERIQGAKSTSGSPAKSAKASNNSGVGAGRDPEAECPRACKVFIRSSASSSS